MVATDDDIRADFSQRLAKALKESSLAPDDPRSWRPWMAKRYGVSQEAARKWLSGMAIPEMTKLAKISVDLDKTADYLLTGRGAYDAPVGIHLSSDEDTVIANYRKSPDFGKAFIRKIAETAALPARILLSETSRSADTGGQHTDAAISANLNIEYLQFVIEQAAELRGWTKARRAAAIARVYVAIAQDEKAPTKAVVLRLLRSA